MIGPEEGATQLDQERLKQVQNQVNAKTSDILLQEFNNAQVQAFANEIKNDIDNNIDEVKDIKKGDKLPREVRDSVDKMQKASQVSDTVAQTVEAIKNAKLLLPAGKSADVIKLVIGKIELRQITSASAVYINEIINRGLRNELNSANDLLTAFDAIKNLQFIDEILYVKIAESFETKARLYGADQETQDKFKVKTGKTRQDMQKEIEKREIEWRVINERLINEIENINENNLNGTDIERKIIEEAKLYSKLQPEKEEFIRRKKSEEVTRIKRNLELLIQDIARTPHTEDEAIQLGSREDRVKRFKDVARSLYARERVLREDQYQSIEGVANRIQELAEANDDSVRINLQRGRSLLAEADYYTKIQFSPEQRELLDSLDNTDKLKKLLADKYNFDKKDLTKEITWDKFFDDVKDIFEKLFEFAEADPLKFFQEAFNPMYVGHLYDELIGYLRGLGDLVSLDDDLRRRKVKDWDFADLSDQFQTTETLESLAAGQGELSGKNWSGANNRLTHTKTQEVFLSKAINDRLVNRMIQYKNLTEYLHNVNVITELGAGFEQMADYSKNLRLKDIDWLFLTDRDLLYAYNNYIGNLIQELGQNMHVVPVNFGKKNSEGIDTTEQQTIYQILSMHNIRPDNTKLWTKLKRKVRMASAISKGVTGEFWGVLLTARYPLSYRLDKTFEKDKQTGKQKVKNQRFAVEQTFSSSSQSGYEKMESTIDLDMVLERFGVPSDWKYIRFVHCPRSLKMNKIPDAYSERYDHKVVYKRAASIEDAFFDGRDDEQAAFDEKNVILGEYFKTLSIDYFMRGGWRFMQYRAYLEFKRDESGKFIRGERGKLLVDFDKSLNNLKKVGIYAVKTFIDDILTTSKEWQKDITDLDIDNLDVSDPILKELVEKQARGTLKDEDKEKAKIELYEKYVFGRIAKIYPTRYIGMETRRFTPKNEEKILDSLMNFLYNKYKGDYPENYILSVLLPTYVSALQLAEKKTWENNKTEGKIDYTFGQSDIDKLQPELLDFYDYQKSSAGKFKLHGLDVDWTKITPEEFFNTLKEFHKVLRTSVDADRFTLNNKKTKVTLAHRYAYLMANNMGMINHYIRGDDFDFQMFFLQQAGSRPAERMMGETHIATQMTKGMQKMVGNTIPEFVLGHYENEAQLEQAVDKSLATNVFEFTQPIINISKEQANELAVRWTIFLDKMISKDWAYRFKIIGDGLQDFSRRTWGTQGSLITDFFKYEQWRKVTVLDSFGSFIMGKTILSKCHISTDEKKVKGYEDVKILGLTVAKKPIFDSPHKFHMKQFFKAAGVEMKHRLIEASPMLPVIMMIIILLLAKLAGDKNKGGSK